MVITRTPLYKAMKTTGLTSKFYGSPKTNTRNDVINTSAIMVQRAISFCSERNITSTASFKGTKEQYLKPSQAL